MGPEEWLVQRARLVTQPGQGLAPRQQQQRQLKRQQSWVLESSLVLEGAVFLLRLGQFLESEASQVPGLQLQLQLQQQPLRQPSTELLQA